MPLSFNPIERHIKPCKPPLRDNKGDTAAPVMTDALDEWNARKGRLKTEGAAQ
ncbi:hypothetical protein [Neisseria elongata]|uniref:hypothetical protein n=1 Tax=Neisseria elongata TaxID=495 RepID=UPI0028ED9FEB|nr:hypothetical protein [Neisseria elongata]